MAFGQSVDEESLRETVSLDPHRCTDLHFMMDLGERRAEVAVIRKQLEIKLMNQALSRIRNEHSSLLAIFELTDAMSFHIHPE